MPDMDVLPTAEEETLQILHEEKKPSKAGKNKKTLVSKKTKSKKRKKSKKPLVILIILVLLTASAFGIYTLFFGSANDAVALTDFATFGSLNRAIEGSGTTAPLESQAISLATNADIKEVLVSAGDFVEEGQTLFIQDDSEVDDAIEKYNDQIDEYKDQIITYEESIDDYNDTIDDCNDNIESYNEEIADLYEEMQGLTVYAPYSGRITSLNVEDGDTVTTSTSLAVITNDSTLKLTQYFSYSYKDLVYVGMPATLSVADQMLILDAKVSDIQYVERIATDGMICFGVTVEVDNPGSLTEGSSAACYLVADDSTRVYPAIESTLEYAKSTTIYPEVTGTLSSVRIVDYQIVNKGDVLFSISSDSYDNQLKNLEKQIKNAEKQITQAESQIKSYTERIDTNNTKIDDVNEQIADAQETREDYIVKAEISGKVMYVNASAGTVSNFMMMQTAVTIYNLDAMTISVNIDELDVDYLYEGMTVTVFRTSAETTTPYMSTITYISPEASSSNGVATFPATIEIPSNGELASGVNVTYSVNVGDTEESVLVPISALKDTEQGNCLFVKSEKAPNNAITLDSGDVEVPKGFFAVPVEVGSSNNYYIRILSGVEEGAEVFLRYQQSAPSGGDTTSENQDTTDTSQYGQMPGGNFSGSPPSGMQGGFSGSGMSGGPPG